MQRRSRDRNPIKPMTLGNIRSLGVVSLDAICEETLCGHAGQINVSVLPDGFPVIDVALRLRCSRYGSKSVSTRPNWLEYRASGTPNGLRN
ncbi:MAG: hypothetical protein Q8M31_15150 [Beijerinckiaceae bacterium]|nr:hypothetical protein [Beijerinckiaceae bacterium]